MISRCTLTPLLLLTLLAPLAGGCATTRNAYYNAWEKFGYAKRERLVDDVKSARDEQNAAKQQFTSALEQFKSVVHFQGGDLEATYNKLNKEYEACDSRASAVNSKVTTVQHVGSALFDEWSSEIAQMKDDPSLQQKSQQLYDKTHASYDQMISRMQTAAASMAPVLTHFHNRVLYIKANLNAQALASLSGTEVELGSEIDQLVKEMEASIAEADKFISQVEAKK